MTSKLGCHWLREHPDKFDIPHIEAMQYPSIKLFKPAWDNANFCRDLLTVLPKHSYILARDHELSEQKEGMWSKPEEHGTYHANEWAMKVASGQVHVPVERTFFLGINEPDATNGDRNAIDIYTAAFLERLRIHGLRGGAFNFSTGHPRTVDGTPKTPADYSVFERSHRAIVNGHHIGVLHIYGTGAVPCAPGHYDRLQACTWQDVEWVVGEFGVDEHVIGGGEHAGFHKYFNGRLDDYCGWLDTAIIGINDPRIHSYQVFTYDFSHPWDSFDTHPIRAALESYQWQHTKQSTPQPAPVTPAQPPYVPAPSEVLPKPVHGTVSATVLNVRSGPATDYPIVRQLAQGDVVTITAISERVPSSEWLQIGVGEWVIGAWVRTIDEPIVDDGPTPAPPPTGGDTWERSIQWVLKREGGFQNNPADKGNYYQDKLIGTKFGISAAFWGGQYDIPNLTIEQARNIYFEHYWRKSRADKLEWPLCLLVLDSCVLHGTGATDKWLAEVGPNPYAFAAKRLRVYAKSDNGDTFWRGWVNRVSDLLEEIGKP